MSEGRQNHGHMEWMHQACHAATCYVPKWGCTFKRLYSYRELCFMQTLQFEFAIKAYVVGM